MRALFDTGAQRSVLTLAAARRAGVKTTDPGAIADDDAALKLMPASAWSLYGRGLAKQLQGHKAEGDVDIAAAIAIAPRIADEVRKSGIGS
jgi:hypothetical protein